MIDDPELTQVGETFRDLARELEDVAHELQDGNTQEAGRLLRNAARELERRVEP